VWLWDVATQQQNGNLHTSLVGNVNSITFSPDGLTLATGNGDGTVRLWDVATHQQIGDPITIRASPVDSVTFSPDGETLATGNDDGTVRLWDVAYLVNTVPQLCASVGRSLTRAGWAQYVPPGPGYQEVCRQ
jgi:WD40 repeat protein